MNDERRILLGGVLVALVLGLLVLRASTSHLGHAELRAHSPGEDAPVPVGAQDGREGRGVGVVVRAVDPAIPSAGWRSSELDPELLDQVLEQPLDAVLLDVDSNTELIPWLEGLVTDDAFGRAVAECRRSHERHQRGRCNWDQDVVLQRSPDGETTVVAVEPRTIPGEHSPETSEMASDCRAWARCVAAAWKERPGRFPHGVDDRVTTTKDGAQLVALRSGVHHLEAYGLDPAAYRARYEEAMAQLEAKMEQREQAYQRAEDEGLRSRRSLDNLYYSLLLERGRHDDYRRYLEYLQEHAP
ncbi:hypothetical protein [Paraliomyxa miuraensis]|uniref:hypothetical protein n=1 Tax=Paraliomyxa miuraensis TaxID=376150 RepID=UPI002252D889|nr:hypothetical protein [Paraliomyxa miuraensis]MCX4247974.1 hypothetical protein [Paraliomyxa miuraensis]